MQEVMLCGPGGLQRRRTGFDNVCDQRNLVMSQGGGKGEDNLEFPVSKYSELPLLRNKALHSGAADGLVSDSLRASCKLASK